MMRRFYWATVIIFFITVIIFVVIVNISRPRLLILHSYSPDYIWTAEVDKGLARVLDGNYFVRMRTHYMKTKRFNDKESLRRAGRIAIEVINQSRPDVILAIDDYAQKLAAQYYVDKPGISIVFAAVNGEIDIYGYDKASNVTGILERKPVNSIKEVVSVLGVKPNKGSQLRLRFLADSSLAARRDAELFVNVDWGEIDYQGAIFVDDFTSWKKEISTLQNQTDIILVGGYRKLKYNDGRKGFVAPEELMQWTDQNSTLPVVGNNIFNSRDGAMFSLGVSPYEQGEVSATMALEILLNNRKAKDIPIATSQQFVVAMRESSLRRRGLNIPRVYEAFARATENYFP